MKALNLLAFPLDSLSLIEASAGTGKTYALANLYLRYLLERKCSVEEILVVTFTEAATQELKDRIRIRIQELGAVFDGQESNDEVLNYLYKASSSPESDRLLLKLSERQIDQAEIHTIHGFCQQVLRRYALDSNVPLQQTLLEDQRSLLKQIVEDFWRQQVLTLATDEVAFICSNWAGPEDLLNAIFPLLNRSPERVMPAPLENGISAWKQQYQSSLKWLSELKERTLKDIAEVDQLIAKSSLKRLKDKQNWLKKIRYWSEATELDFNVPKSSKGSSLFSEFIPAKLAEQTKAKGITPEHSYFNFLENHLLLQPESLEAQFIVQAYQLIETTLKRTKQEQRVFSFDDLITSVSNALKSANTSSANTSSANTTNQTNVLAEAVRARYQVALIDEFQDTDPVQYHIFSTLFGPAASVTSQSRPTGTNTSKTKPSRLVLIGDPKQAIYAFRGGDISTYLKAKKDIAAHPNGHVFTMDTNWRSSPQMVAAVNALFTNLENPFRADEIPFQAVKAAKEKPEHLPSHALCISQLASADLGKAQMSSLLADHCVQQIMTLIDGAGSSEVSSAMKHSDIAILVRSGAEAELIKQRLSEVGLSASFEGKSSIYDTTEAKAIYFLLEAVAEPKNEYAIRRCLAEMFFAVDDERFHEINEQASVFSEYLNIFEGLQKLWLRAGVLAMVRDALIQLKVYDAWHEFAANSLKSTESPEKMAHSQTTGWERSLSNINQLAELLQHQSRVYRGHFALIRWLRDNISGADTADDASKLRLESDEQLIRIVTIHKSKGLEYPFVFVPFLFSGRGADEAWFYDPSGRLSLDLLKDEKNLDQADSERLAEDIRLLYVALTRAKYQCFVGTVAYHKRTSKISLATAKTAWAYLVCQGSPPKPLDHQALMDSLSDFQARHADIILLKHINEADILAANTALAPELQLKPVAVTETDISECSSKLNGSVQVNFLHTEIRDDWRVHSFTGLMNENQRLQPHSLLNHSVSPALSEATTIFGFPKGSRAGTFLHTLFESIVFETAEPISPLSSQFSNLEELIHSKLKLSKLVEEELITQWASYLQNWIKSVLAYSLQTGIKLRDLKENDYISEMSFYYSIEQLNSKRFNALLERHGYAASNIEFGSFKGHMKGAIDLIFKANSQYFILDYKSNYLGNVKEDYHISALESVMDEHRYDVQYLLYTLATHRYLKHRLGGAYNYERDFGGVYYLFLRGLSIDEEYTQEYDEEALIERDDSFESTLKEGEGALIERNDSFDGALIEGEGALKENASLDNQVGTADNATGVVFIKPSMAIIDALDNEISNS